MQHAHTRLALLVAAAAWIALAPGCSSDSGAGGAADGAGAGDQDAGVGGTDGASAGEQDASGAVANPTWHRDIAPLLHDKCSACHVAGGIGPFAFEDYDQTAALSGIIVSEVEAGTMPPWQAVETETCAPRLPWAHDARLSEGEKATLRAWHEAGAPEGDAGDAQALEPIPTPALTRVDKSLQPKVGWATEGLQDDFVCFVLDPAFTETAYMSGVHFVAEVPEVAHHALLYYAQRDAAEAKANDDGYYPCFGGPGLNAELIAAWAPGGVPAEYPPKTATPLDPGGVFVLQMHYHPIGPKTAPDRTTVQLKLEEEAPEWVATSQLVGNFHKANEAGAGTGLLPVDGESADDARFEIPAGAQGHVEEMAWELPEKFGGAPMPGLFVWAVAPHMHYVGRDMEIWVERGANPPETSAPLTKTCEEDNVAPFEACLADHCAGVGLSSLEDCVVGNCLEPFMAMDEPCSDCLVGMLGSGTDVPGAFTACKQGAPGYSYAEKFGGLPPRPEHECLLHTPAYDFNWQRFYSFDAPNNGLPFLGPGDTLRWRCVYDNSLANPFVAEALQYQGLDAPQTVYLGEETLDEMCLVALVVLTKP